LRDLGVRIANWAPRVRPAARWVYVRLPAKLHDTPTSWLELRFGNQRDFTFIQVGAYDGITGDPIRPLVLSHPNWQGALIEPMPDAFAQLKNNYASMGAKLHFFNCAVSDNAGTIELHQITESEIARLGLPDWSREITSFDENHIRKHFPEARTVG